MNGAELSKAARAEFSAAKRWWRWLLLAPIFGALLTAVAAIVPTNPVALFVGVTSIVSIPIIYWCRKEADDAYERGEHWRRLSLLNDGLGIDAEPGELARLQAEATPEPTDDPEPLGSYYNSPHAPGPMRLAHVLWESVDGHEEARDSGEVHR